MPAIALRAHYDGKHICLDEQFELSPNAQLLVTVLPSSAGNEDAWSHLAAQNLNRAYGTDEAEPEYTLADIKP